MRHLPVRCLPVPEPVCASGSHESGECDEPTTELGELGGGEQPKHTFSQRTKSGGRIEYLCKVKGGVQMSLATSG